MPCPRTQHRNNVPILRGEKIIFLCKSCTKWDSKPHGRQRSDIGKAPRSINHCAMSLPAFVHIKDGWMFEQHWATYWCRRPSGGKANGAAGESPIPSLSDTNYRRCLPCALDRRVGDGGYLWYKVVYNAQISVSMAINDLEIKLV